MLADLQEEQLTKRAITAVHASDVAAMTRLSYDDPLAILDSAPYPEEPWYKGISPSTIFVLLSGALAILFLLHEMSIAGVLGFPTDEAWIHQVYAKNFFPHVSFEFNPGERTAGPTAPFWIVFLAIGRSLFHDGILAAKLLGSVFLFLTGYYTFRLLRATNLDYGSAVLAGVLTMTSASLAWAELSGLESTLSAALVVGGLWWYFSGPRGWRRYTTGAIFAMAALTRPETTLLFLLVLTHALWRGHKYKASERHQHYVRDAILTLLTFVVVLIPIAVTNVAMAGAIIPETFYAGLGRKSIIVLLRHGNIGDLAFRLMISLRSIWFVMKDILLPQNPLFICTIIAALLTSAGKKMKQRDRSKTLFLFLAASLLLFPYLRAVALGTDDLFGEHGRWMHFLIPLYTICGALSIRILLRRHHYRGMGDRGALLGTTAALIAASLLELGLRDTSGGSFSTLSPLVDIGLLIFFTTLLTIAAFRYAQVGLFRDQQEHVVTEEERNKMSFQRLDDQDTNTLPELTTRILCASLLIVLGWNLSQLPRAANDFGYDVRLVNEDYATFARSLSSRTLPSDVIATNAIGVVGMMSDRKVIDIEGRLVPRQEHEHINQADISILHDLSHTRPAYLFLTGHRFDESVNLALSQHLLEPIATTPAAALYHINYDAEAWQDQGLRNK